MKKYIFYRWLVINLLFFSEAVFAGTSSVCIKVQCRTKYSSGSLQILNPFRNTLNIGEKISVKMTPIHASYGSYFKAGSSSLFYLSLDGMYSQVSYLVSDVERKGSALFGGFGFSWQKLFAPKNIVHNFYIKSTFFPYSNFSVKSTTTTQIVAQNEASDITTQTVVTYAGSLGIKLETALMRYVSNPFSTKLDLHYGLSVGFMQQNFKTKTEQSLEKLNGGEATLKSPTQVPISFSYQMGFVALFLGTDL